MTTSIILNFIPVLVLCRYGVYSTISEELTYSSGGHPPALLFPGSRLTEPEMVLLRTPDFIIGDIPSTYYHNSIQKIIHPASIFVFSDGV